MPSLHREIPRNLVGPVVRRLRSQSRYSQSDLAARCGARGWDVSRDVIARIEGRYRWVADWELAILASALNAETQDLYPAKLKVRAKEMAEILAKADI